MIRHLGLRERGAYSVKEFRFLLMSVLLFAFSLAGQKASTLTPNTVAERVWTTFRALEWGAPYGKWRNTHSETACEQFHEDGGFSLADDQWCYRCSQAIESPTSEWFFYAFPYEDPPACRLEQFRGFVGGLSRGELEEIRSELILRMNAEYGPSRNPGRPLGEFGSASWKSVQRWETTKFQITVYLEEDRDRPARLGLLARQRPLLDAREEDSRLQAIEWAGLRPGGKLDLRMVEELRRGFPEISSLLAKDPVEVEPQQVRATLLRILESAKPVTSARVPVMLLAADRLAERLGYGAERLPDWEKVRSQLAGFGLVYEWDELGGTWHYTHSLLFRIWRDFSATPWGEDAFLLLQGMGWDGGVGCKKGSDRFREVIDRAEEFLKRRPESPHRLQVLFALGQAYETWWSASRASVGDIYVERARYLEGSEVARKKAIGYYEQVLRLAPEGLEAAYARRELPRLKLGIDTNQRRFYCIYD